MTSDFQLKLKELLQLIKDYEKELKIINGKNELQSRHKAHFLKLKAVFKVAQKALNESTQIDDCTINVKLIQPLTSPVYLPKCKVVLDVEAKEKCDWLNQEIKLDFATKIERKWTTTRTIVLSKEQWSFEGNDLKAVVTFELTFNDEEQNVTIDYGGTVVAVQYVKYAAMKLDSPSNATKTKENFNPLYAKSELREQIKAIFPKATFLINSQTDWKSTLVSSSIKEDLESTAIVGLNQNLEILNKDELSALNGLIASRKKALTEANQIFKKTLQRYEGLEFNYDGEKSVIFDAAYHKNIEESRIAIHAIAERLKILKEVLATVLDAQLELKRAMSMPPSPFVIASKEFSKKLEVFWVEIQEINTRFDNYNDLSLSYEAWGKELNDTTLQLSALNSIIKFFNFKQPFLPLHIQY